MSLYILPKTYTYAIQWRLRYTNKHSSNAWYHICYIHLNMKGYFYWLKKKKSIREQSACSRLCTTGIDWKLFGCDIKRIEQSSLTVYHTSRTCANLKQFLWLTSLMCWYCCDVVLWIWQYDSHLFRQVGKTINNCSAVEKE